MTTDLPYAGTSGWSGSETSQARAEREDANGTTSMRQRETIKWLTTRGRLGLTWRELALFTDWHHGQASGVLSVLHKVGRVARLKETRERCAVYVLPEFVEDRETSPHGGKRGPVVSSAENASIERLRLKHNETWADSVTVTKRDLTNLLSVALRSIR